MRSAAPSRGASGLAHVSAFLALGVAAMASPAPEPGAAPQLNKLSRTFFDRPTLEIARELLSKVLVRRCPHGQHLGRIVETEAYTGHDDRASHASRGRTRRNEVMFGGPGYAYVYQVYGMYYCLNLVTEAEGFPAAVLIRAVEPVAGIEARTDGPGKVCRAMHIDRSLNGADLLGDELYVADSCLESPSVALSPRIGVDYAGEWASKPWRFHVSGNSWVSRSHRNRAAGRPQPGA